MACRGPGYLGTRQATGKRYKHACSQGRLRLETIAAVVYIGHAMNAASMRITCVGQTRRPTANGESLERSPRTPLIPKDPVPVRTRGNKPASTLGGRLPADQQCLADTDPQSNEHLRPGLQAVLTTGGREC